MQVDSFASEKNVKTKMMAIDALARYSVREKTEGCDSKIKDFFYDTFYLPDGLVPLPKEILTLPYYQKYICNLGNQEGDICFEAYDVLTNEIVGVAWTRIIHDEEGLNSNEPFLLISVSSGYRGKGIGGTLLRRVISELRRSGYTKVTLSVHRQNRAVSFYKRYGFSVYDSDAESYQMIKFL